MGRRFLLGAFFLLRWVLAWEGGEIFGEPIAPTNLARDSAVSVSDALRAEEGVCKDWPGPTLAAP